MNKELYQLPQIPQVGRHFAKSHKVLIIFLATVGLAIGSSFWFHNRYKVAKDMTIKLRELSKAEYPANPAQLSSMVLKNNIFMR
jgi:hypothetical protein